MSQLQGQLFEFPAFPKINLNSQNQTRKTLDILIANSRRIAHIFPQKSKPDHHTFFCHFKKGNDVLSFDEKKRGLIVYFAVKKLFVSL